MSVFAFGLVLASANAFAQTGVNDPDMTTPIYGMKAIAEHTKTLGFMARGTTAFDDTEAQAALNAVRVNTARIPVLFAP